MRRCFSSDQPTDHQQKRLDKFFQQQQILTQVGLVPSVKAAHDRSIPFRKAETKAGVPCDDAHALIDRPCFSFAESQMQRQPNRSIKLKQSCHLWKNLSETKQI
jgi:hypothetical protein